MSPLDTAISHLQGDYTCILCAEGRLLTSQKRGIAPLLGFYEEGRLKNAAVADKIIGKAAALLLISGGAGAVYGQVMSENALALLTRAGLEVRYGTLAPYIINRKGDGMCPMEQTVAHMQDPAEAPAALKATLCRLEKQNGI